MNELSLLTGSDSGADKLFVDDVFSSYTYTGNGSTQTITNGIDLAGKGGMVWIKDRQAVASHFLEDTVRGAGALLQTNSTAAQATGYGGSFGSSGFTLAHPQINTNASFFASWTFRKAKKFFDVVTYVGNNGVPRAITHSLGVAPGMILVKCVTGGGSWSVYHRSLANTEYLELNTTAAKATAATYWNSVTADASTFSLGSNVAVNNNGDTFVAYLFAHDASADGIVQCGSFTTDASGNATVNLGWEPQYLMVKTSSVAGSWEIFDQSRGWNLSFDDRSLLANSANAEGSASRGNPTATGFYYSQGSSIPFIYLAIRRPNKPPTTGTQVYNAIARTGTGAAATVTGVGFTPDLVVASGRASSYGSVYWDRLRGPLVVLRSAFTNKDESFAASLTDFSVDGVTLGADTLGYINQNNAQYINHFFKRAPGVFDQVCYTGTGVAKTEAHGLGVVPELIITKTRSIANGWRVYHSGVGATSALTLETTGATSVSSVFWNNTTPTSTVFTVGTNAGTNYNAQTMVAYLFATKAGISKVGSYTGNGTSQTIDCGFTTGARFVMIKRTDAAGDWYVWDTVRGLVAGNDPHISLNTQAAEVTTNDSVDPASVGLIVNQLAATNINVTSATYIYLAFA